MPFDFAPEGPGPLTTTARLLRARRRLAQPSGWTKMALARDAKGREATPASATSFCLLGALLTNEDDKTSEWAPAADCIRKAIYGSYGPIAEWNNDPDRTHEEILDVLDKAIVLSLAEASVE